MSTSAKTPNRSSNTSKNEWDKVHVISSSESKKVKLAIESSVDGLSHIMVSNKACKSISNFYKNKISKKQTKMPMSINGTSITS